MKIPPIIIAGLAYAWVICHPRRLLAAVVAGLRATVHARHPLCPACGRAIATHTAPEMDRCVDVMASWAEREWAERESARPVVAPDVPAHGEPVTIDPSHDLVHWSPTNTTACGLDWVNVTRWTIEAAYLVTCPGCLAALKSCGHATSSAGELEYAPPVVRIVPAPDVGRWGRVPGRPLQPAPGVLASEKNAGEVES